MSLWVTRMYMREEEKSGARKKRYQKGEREIDRERERESWRGRWEAKNESIKFRG
jgi:hypothetical protein